MAKQELHDVREYYIMVTKLDLNPVGTVTVIPIPFSAQVVRMSAVAEVVADATTNVTLQLSGIPLALNGSTAFLAVILTDAVGQVRTQEYSPLDPINAALEGEDNDAVADMASLALVSGGQATVACSYTFVITLRA